MIAEQPDVFAASVRRMRRSIAVLTLLGTIAAAIVWRLPGAAGFLIGAALSFVTFHRWRAVVSRLGTGAPANPRAWLLALAPLGLALLLYVILRFSAVKAMAVLGGLFTALAAALCEALYQLCRNMKSG